MPGERLRPENQSRNWQYACVVGLTAREADELRHLLTLRGATPIQEARRAELQRRNEPPAIVLKTAQNMAILWNELVWMHERIPYQLFRRVINTFGALAGNTKDEAQKAAYLARVEELKAVAQTVRKGSYQGFAPAQYKALRAEVKRMKNAAELLDQDDPGRKHLLADAAEVRAEIFKLPRLDLPLEERINRHVQERGGELGLPVWCKWQAGDAFKLALQAYAKRIRFAPRYKRGGARLDSIHIEQRTDSGSGWPVEQLFERRRPFSVRPETERGGNYDGWDAHGWFAINGERVPITLVMQRPFPAGAIVKRYSLIGHKERSTGIWEYRMSFQLEVPPVQVLHKKTNCVLAIDAGWRHYRERAMQEDSIRALTIFDGFQAYEVVVPFDLSNARERRTENADKPRIDLRETWEMKRERAAWLEACKADIRRLDVSAWPDAAIRSLSGLAKMRDGGLLRLRDLLAAEGLICEPIEAWLEQDRPAWIRQRHVEKRWIETRDSLARQWAAELAEQADVIIWEGALGLGDMAKEPGKKKAARKQKHAETGEWDERTGNERALEEAQKWRTMASLAQWRGWIREAMEKRGREIIDGETAFSSQECYICGEHIEPSALLYVTCENNHRHDQDENSTRLLWNHLDGDMRAVAAPLAPVRRSQLLRTIRPLSA